MDWLKYLTGLAIFLTLGLIIWSFQDPICVNSSIVKKIDIESRAGLYSFLSCGYQNSAMESDLPITLRSTYFKIQKVIAQFEIFKDQIDQSYAPKKIIRVLLQKPQKFEWTDSQLEIGIDFFETTFGFRRALVQAWLKGFLKPELSNNKIIFETLTDIYSLMIWSKPENFMESERWLDDVLTEESLCLSDWKPFDRQIFCEDLHLAFDKVHQQTKSLREVSPWSLRPLIVKDFWRKYSNLNGFQKIDFAQLFTENLSRSLLDKIDLTLVTDLENLARVYKVLSHEIFQATPVPSRSTHIDFYVHNTLKRFNIYQHSDLIQVAKEIPDFNVLIRSHDEFIILPGLTRVRVGYAQPESKHQALIACDPPVLENVLVQNVQSERVLFVKQCDPAASMNLADFVLYGVEVFSENGQNNFMVFHIPSLKIAKNTWKLNTKQVLDVHGPNVPVDVKSKLFGWSKFEPATLYKVNAVLPIVEWLRY